MRLCPNCGLETEERYCPNDDATTLDPGVFGDGKADLEGQVFASKYRVLELLGEGGCGAVYKAFQWAMDRMVALKVMHANLSEDVALVKRFSREVRTSAKLEHPNTIRIYDCGDTEGGLYYAMQYLSGITLTQLIKSSAPLPEQRVCNIVVQALKSLAEAHELGVVHRDLKPDNIFIHKVHGEQDYVKVLDFGIAKLVYGDDKEGALTVAGQTFGTPKYMSPEQAQALKLDGRSDLYSLGVILYEMLTGKPPFVAEAPVAVLMMHVNQPPPPLPPELGISKPIDDLVMRMLAKKPEERPEDADEIIQLIGNVLAVNPRESGLFRLPSSASVPAVSAEDAPSQPPSGPPAGLELSPSLHEDETVAHPGLSPEEIAAAVAATGKPPTAAGAGPEPSGVEQVGAETPDTDTGAPSVVVASSLSKRKTSLVFAIIGILVLLGLAAAHIIVSRSWPLKPMTQSQPAYVPAIKKHLPAVSQPAATQKASTQPATTQAAATQPAAGTQPSEKKPLLLTLDSEPSGAAVLLDGEQVGRTPHEYQWREGETAREFVFQLDGYDPLKVKLERGKEGDTYQAKLQKQTPAETKIETKPKVCVVFKKRKKLGKTPFVYKWEAEEKEVELKFARRGYGTLRKKLVRSKDMGQTIQLRLQKLRW